MIVNSAPFHSQLSEFGQYFLQIITFLLSQNLKGRTNKILLYFSLPGEFLIFIHNFFLPSTFEPMLFFYLTTRLTIAKISSLLSSKKQHCCKSSFTDLYIFLNTPTNMGNIWFWFKYCSILTIVLVLQIFSPKN